MNIALKSSLTITIVCTFHTVRTNIRNVSQGLTAGVAHRTSRHIEGAPGPDPAQGALLRAPGARPAPLGHEP